MQRLIESTPQKSRDLREADAPPRWQRGGPIKDYKRCRSWVTRTREPARRSTAAIVDFRCVWNNFSARLEHLRLRWRPHGAVLAEMCRSAFMMHDSRLLLPTSSHAAAAAQRASCSFASRAEPLAAARMAARIIARILVLTVGPVVRAFAQAYRQAARLSHFAISKSVAECVWSFAIDD